MKRSSLLFLAAILLFGCNKSSIVSEPNNTEKSSLAAPPTAGEYIDLSGDSLFMELFNLDMTIESLIGGTNVFDYDYSILNDVQSESEYDSLLAVYGFDPTTFNSLIENRLILFNQILTKYPDLVDNSTLTASMYYSYHNYYNNSGVPLNACLDAFNDAVSACEIQLATATVGGILAGVLGGPIGAIGGYSAIALALINHQACMKSARSAYVACK